MTAIQQILTAALLFLSLTAFAQEEHYFQEEEWIPKMDTLNAEFGKNKTLPKDIALACLLALSHYPELKDARIEFRQKKLSSTMMAQPAPSFIFKKRKKRSYRIFINNAVNETTGLHIDELSFNALVGWIGHELAHLADYNGRSALSVVGTGLTYFLPRKKARYERATDQMTIEHGLGYALYEGTYYVANYANITEKYRERKKNYYSAAEILTAIEEWEEKRK